MRTLFAALVATFYLISAPGAFAQSLRDMAGQMIMIGFQHDNSSSAAHKQLLGLVRDGDVGGVMYLKYNVKSLKSVAAMNASFHKASPAGMPVLIAIDQEGGVVERLTSDVGFKEIPRARDVALNMNKDSALALYADLAKRMAALGFNVNFGPVVDVIVNQNNPIISKYGRSFSSKPDIVTKFAASFIDGHHAAGMLTALKHFPGHGSSRADSHLGFVDISDTWQEREYEPFRDLIANGKADMMMSGHLYHSAYVASGDKQVPASLSPVALTKVLREGMGYNGVIISDDMEMGAITKHYGFEEAIVRAVNAGNDILLFSNTVKPSLDLPERILTVLLREADRDPQFKAKIERSYQRIVAMKQRVGQ
jgi:beta-N-acetylhexosaminidase